MSTVEKGEALTDPTRHDHTGADLNSCTFCHLPLSAHTAKGGKLVEVPCPRCDHTPTYEEDPKSAWKHTHFCHACSTSFTPGVNRV